MKGVNFGDTHSYYDLNLILSECSISPAKPKTNYIDIPGADGSIDLTEALGDVKYNDRTGSLVFSVLPSDDFEEKKSEISNFLNGKHFDKITLDKDPDWYYVGRCSVNDYKSDKMQRQIIVDLVLHPFKYAQEEKRFVHNTANAEMTFNVNGLSVIPMISNSSSDISITLNGATYLLSAGKNKYQDICLKPGENVVYKSGGHLVTFIFRERSL